MEKERKSELVNKRDRRRLWQMFHAAEEWQFSLIDAHRIGLAKRHGQVIRVIPKSHRKDTDKWERDVKAWLRLVRRLTAEAKAR